MRHVQCVDGSVRPSLAQGRAQHSCSAASIEHCFTGHCLMAAPGVGATDVVAFDWRGIALAVGACTHGVEIPAPCKNYWAIAT